MKYFCFFFTFTGKRCWTHLGAWWWNLAI